MKRFSWLFFSTFLCLASTSWAQKSEEEAGDVSEVDKDATGPLRERIRPVSGHLLLMEGRFEVSPGVAVSVRDAFFTKYTFGLALAYHFTEAWALALRGAYALPIIANSAQICTPASGCRAPTYDELTQEGGVRKNRAFGLINVLASADLQWSPIYGKLSFSSERFFSFNMFASLGPSLVVYGPNGAVTVGGNVGLGFRFFFNRWVTLRTELRDVIYYEQGDVRNSLRNQLLFEVGLSLFFPTVFEEK
jgi:outer membrane beta-barrel protein